MKELTSSQWQDDIHEISLRPSYLKDFIGQEQLKSNLQVFIDSTKARNKSLDHVLLYGPPGLGKTTIAQIIASELGSSIKCTAAPMITKVGDLAAILTNLSIGDVLFIDEIHRLGAAVEEVLYSAMEDYALDLMIGEGPSARSVRINLQPFTLIGATTRLGLLSGPLRDRFGIPLRLEFYEPEELQEIIKSASSKLKFNITEDGATEIAKRSRGTPRITLRLLKRVGDFATIYKKPIDHILANKALLELEVDQYGLDSNDRRYLKFIADNYNGGPVGIETISAGLAEQKDSIEETIEPYLLQQGFVQRTKSGRVITPKSFIHLGIIKYSTPIGFD